MGSSTSPSSLDATGVESKNTASSTAEVQVATKPTPVDYEREKDAASSDPELNDDGVIKEPETKKPAITGTPAVAPAITYPSGLLASILNIALLLSLFLVALDMSIIATAIPTITAKFHSEDQVGWYGSAFFMCLAAFQAFWGKAYKYFPLKAVFLTCITVFEIGSLVIAVAPNSTTIIVGRAIQGTGGAGITGGCYIILAFITEPKHLHKVMGLSSTVWSCSSVLGPVLGGLFTENITWRWCFYVNLPIGGAAIVILLIFFKTPPHSRHGHAKLKEIPLLFDLGGTVLVLAAMTCLLLALQDGGVTKPWSNGQPIGLLVGFVLITILFVFLEWKQGDRAMVVFRIIKRRTIWTLAIFSVCAQASGFARNYNLPIFFQAVQGVSPSESGIRTLPTVLTISLCSFVGSLLLGKLGYYQAFLWVGGIFSTVGAGLVYTLEPYSKAGAYIGYQVLASIGSGLVIQLPVIVAQSISPRPDMAITIAITLFCQFVGGTIGVSAAQNIMNNIIVKSLPTNNPNLSPEIVLSAGSASLRDAFPDPTELGSVVSAYMQGLRAAWIWSIVLAGLSFLVAFAAEWKSVRTDDVKKRNEAKKAAAEATTV